MFNFNTSVLCLLVSLFGSRALRCLARIFGALLAIVVRYGYLCIVGIFCSIINFLYSSLMSNIQSQTAHVEVSLDVLPFETIKANYPDEWVLIGNPELRDPDVQAAVVRKLVRGIVVAHGIDRRQVANSAQQYRSDFKTFAFVWTGEIPAMPKHLL